MGYLNEINIVNDEELEVNELGDYVFKFLIVMILRR